jgi:hypothetical protein
MLNERILNMVVTIFYRTVMPNEHRLKIGGAAAGAANCGPLNAIALLEGASDSLLLLLPLELRRSFHAALTTS